MRFLLARTTRASTRWLPDAEEPLVALTYELLDAHADTARLVMDQASDQEWQNHLAYLRDLQRVGREALARTRGARL